MLHYIFIVCILALSLPTFTALPIVPGYELFFAASAFASIVLNTSETVKNNFLVVFSILFLHLTYIQFNLYSETAKRSLLDFIIPVLVCNVFFDYYEIRPIKFNFLIKFFSITLFITAVTTSITLQTYPDASRLLAGQLSSEGKIDEGVYYMLLGVGDYVFSILWLFFSLTFGYLLSRKSLYWIDRKILLAFLLMYIFALYFASYTTPLLILLLGIGLMKFRDYFSSPKKIIVLSTLIYLFFLVSKDLIASALYGFADILKSENISPRLVNIAMRLDGSLAESGFSNTSDFELEKENLYLGAYELRAAKSWDSFLNNPATGGGETGGHNFFIDLLGLYGIIGFLLVALIIYSLYNRSLNAIKSKDGKIFYRFLFLLFLFLGLVKTYILLPFFFLLFFILPLFINLITLYNFNSVQS